MALFKAVKKPVIRQAASEGPASSALRPRYAPKAAPCSTACPIGCDVRGALQSVAEGGSFETAWRILTARNPFPSMTGRLCEHPCQTPCHRQAKDGAVSIQSIERFLGDWAVEERLQFTRPKQLRQRVAVLGAGPAGLSAAYHLARRGYTVAVFGVEPELSDPEIRRILELGVTISSLAVPDASFAATLDTAALESAGFAESIANGMHEAEAADVRLRGITVARPAPRPPVARERIKLSWYPAALPLDAVAGPTAPAAPDPILAEAKRCMSCGMCMFCGNCWMYCSHSGFEKLAGGRRYRLTPDACNGCKKCADECPSGYIDMV